MPTIGFGASRFPHCFHSAVSSLSSTSSRASATWTRGLATATFAKKNERRRTVRRKRRLARAQIMGKGKSSGLASRRESVYGSGSFHRALKAVARNVPISSTPGG